MSGITTQVEAQLRLDVMGAEVPRQLLGVQQDPGGVHQPGNHHAELHLTPQQLIERER